MNMKYFRHLRKELKIRMSDTFSYNVDDSYKQKEK